MKQDATNQGQEWEYNDTVDSAITQIHKKQYPRVLEDYKGKLLLVGIRYDRKTKEHQCRIEKM